ncbi:MAG: leucine-rich repeat protein, partial [Acutalibacteraceae bacterium]
MKERTRQTLRQIRIRATALLIICAMAVTSMSTFAGMDVFAAELEIGTAGNISYVYNPDTGALSLTGSGALWCPLGYSYITSIKVSGNFTSVCDSAFYRMENLKSIHIPDSVTSLGKYTFEGCSNLTSMNIPINITYIGDSVFFDCISLKSIVIPNSVTSIGPCAFYDCYSLTSVTIPDSVKSINRGAFENCNSLTSVTIPDSVKFMDSGAFYNCNSLTSLKLSNSLKKINEGSFYNCSSLTSVVIPDSVTYIGVEAFEYCCNLTSISIPKSVETIETYAFYGCLNLEDVYIYNPDCAFSYNSYNIFPENTIIHGYKGSTAEEYATDTDRTFIEITDEDLDDGDDVVEDETSYADEIKQKFIDEHLEFAETYYPNYIPDSTHNYIIGNENFEEARKSYKVWDAAMMDVFDNPFDVVLADFILDSDTESTIEEIGSKELKATQVEIIEQVIELIDTEAELTADDKIKVKELFEKQDYSDQTTYKWLEETLQTVSEDNLQKIFAVYDKTNLFIDILGDGQKIVQGVAEVIEYCSLLDAYLSVSDDFNRVLLFLYQRCSEETAPNTIIDASLLQKSLESYLNVTEDNVNEFIAKKIAETGISTTNDIFGELTVSKVKDFLFTQLVSSDAAEAVLSKVNGFIAGAKIGYSISSKLCNSVLDLSNSADAYGTFYASAEMACYLKDVLDNIKSAFCSDPTYEMASLFCEAYRMYQELQVNIARYGIRYCDTVDASWYSRLFDPEGMMAISGQLSVRKLYWENYGCPLLENVSVAADLSAKFITVACPVDVNIKDSNGNTVVDIKNGEVIQQSDCAEVLVSDNIKYIALLNNDDYKINITATDDGTMDYYVTDLDSSLNVINTTSYSGIKLTNAKEYSGSLEQSPDEAKVDYQLKTDGSAVDCDSKTYNADSYVHIEKITVNKDKLELNEGDTIKLSAEVSPANATAKTFSWASSDESVANVDEYGNVKAISGGTAVIHCYGVFSETMTSIPVTVKSSKITLTTTSLPTNTEFTAMLTSSDGKAYSVNGVYSDGTTTFNVEAPAGTYELRITAPGYTTYTDKSFVLGTDK